MQCVNEARVITSASSDRVSSAGSNKSRDYRLSPGYSGRWGGGGVLWDIAPCNSMEQRFSWEANRFSLSQEISHLLRNPKVHYRIHKSPLPVPIFSQIDPVHDPQPTSVRSILILSSHLRLGLSIALLPSGFRTKTLYAPLRSPTRATCPAHLSLLDLITRIIFGDVAPCTLKKNTDVSKDRNVFMFRVKKSILDCWIGNMEALQLFETSGNKLLSHSECSSWNICTRPKESGLFGLRYYCRDIIIIIISNLSDDRSTASSKTIPPLNAI
jgi:hypothetical protein